MKAFRVIVAGGRDFRDWNLLLRTLDHLLAERLPNVVIRAGEASGADTLAKRYAEVAGLEYEPFPAEWGNLSHPDAVIKTRKDGTRYDAKAGHRRNLTMATTEPVPDGCVVFWNGISTGSADMINIARSKGIATKVKYY